MTDSHARWVCDGIESSSNSEVVNQSIDAGELVLCSTFDLGIG
jgi:hypothetical protein